MTTSNEISRLARERRGNRIIHMSAWLLGGSRDGVVLGLETVMTNVGVCLAYGPAALGRQAVSGLQALGEIDANYLLASSNQVNQVEE